MNGFSPPVLISLILFGIRTTIRSSYETLSISISQKRQSGLNIGVFFSENWIHDRPEWGVFDHIFPDCCFLSVELRIINFNARKTGLFKPVWMADL
jgi:hypothetical protein